MTLNLDKLSSQDLQSFKKPDFEKQIDVLTKYKPNKWQQVVRQTEARFKVICAGRRSGKTFFVAKDSKDGLVTDLVLPKQRVWVVAPNYDLTQRIWDELYHMAIAEFRPMIARIHNTKGNFRIETVLDTVIEAKSGEEADRLVGAGLTKIIVDEAALLQPKVWNQSLRPTLIDHGGRAVFISTPKGKNWFWELFQRGQQPNQSEWRSWTFSSFDNNYLNQAELKKITKDMPEYEYRQEILAKFEETAEQVFRKFRERAVGELAEPIKLHRYQIGVDLGRKTSYTVVTVVDESVYPYAVVYWDRFRAIDWGLQKERLLQVWTKYPAYRLRLDATGIGDPMVDELERSGLRVEPYLFTEKSKKQLIDKAAIFIEGGRIVYPHLPQLLAELEVYGREITAGGNVKYKALTSFTDDAVHSLALAIWGLPQQPIVRRERQPVIYQPLSEVTGY